MYYLSMSQYLKSTYGEHVYKLPLNIKASCPNRDGTIGSSGCIFCLGGGVNSMSEPDDMSISEQLEAGRLRLKSKTDARSFIAYFQNYSNTYAPIEYLKRVYFEAAGHDEVRIISIATRPDCLGDEVLRLLSELKEKKPVWVELGVQTIHEKSARYIRRGYPISVYDKACEKLKALDIDIVAHMIIGLPGESREDMIESADYIASSGISGVKFHLLHVLKGTDLEKEYLSGRVKTLSKDEYIDIVTELIEHFSDQTVIHRLTGDGLKDILVAPLWSANKRDVLNSFVKVMKEKNTQEGRLFKG